MMINKDFFEILACPVCKGPLLEENSCLACKKCGRAYPVKEDIPVLLCDASER